MYFQQKEMYQQIVINMMEDIYHIIMFKLIIQNKE
jgi:hypothetical protein